MLFVCVNSGHYLIIQDDKVVGEVKRQWKNNCRRFKYPEYEYRLIWRSGAAESHRTLADIQKAHPFENYGGYNSVLRSR